MKRFFVRSLAACLRMAYDRHRFDKYGNPIPKSQTAKEAVEYADALVEELFNEEGGEQ